MSNKHAYLIMAYDNFEQLRKLIEVLDDERNFLFVHIDKKAKQYTPKVKNFLAGGASKCSIKIYNDISVYWSHYSQIECELFLLEKAVQEGSFEYYHLLSGQCFPIKNQDYIHNFFADNFGKEFIDYPIYFFNQHQELIMKRVRYYHLFRKHCRNSSNEIVNYFFRGLDKTCVFIQKAIGIDRCKRNNLDVAYGANWFSITDSFAKYVINSRQFIEKNFRFTNCGDELFMQTVLKSSPFLDNLYKETTPTFYGNLRLLDFHRGNPYVYRSDDIDEIKKSEYLFVRKVDERVDNGLLELIKAECLDI